MIPIVQAPMAGVANPEFVAKACRSGLIGSLGAGMMTAPVIRDVVKSIHALVPGKPFNINLFVIDNSPQFDAANLPSWVASYAAEKHYTAPKPPSTPSAPNFADQFAALLEAKPPIASFTFGLISAEQVRECHERGIQVWGTATSAQEVAAWRKVGVDAVVLQGAEAGGHQGTFQCDPAGPRTVNLDDLWTEVRTKGGDTGALIVAGGIMDGATISSWISRGASACQVGTLFLGASDSGVHPGWRQALEGKLGPNTELTRAFSGRWARGITNDFMRAGKGLPALPYPVQLSWTSTVRADALKHQDPHSTSLWAGTGFQQCRLNNTVVEIAQQLWEEYEAAQKARRQRSAI